MREIQKLIKNILKFRILTEETLYLLRVILGESRMLKTASYAQGCFIWWTALLVTLGC
jgi:hypothetical protein